MNETRESEDFARTGLFLSTGGILCPSLYKSGRTDRPFLVEPYRGGYRITLRRARQPFVEPVYLGCDPLDGFLHLVELPEDHDDGLTGLHGKRMRREVGLHHPVNLLLKRAVRACPSHSSLLRWLPGLSHL